MFFLSKLLIKYILIPIFITLLIPIIIVLFMYQPLDFYYKDKDLNQVSFNEILEDGFDTFTENEASSLSFSVHEDQVNYYVFSILSETNANFESENTYFIEDELYGYAGSWFSFNEDRIEFVSKIDIFLTPSITFETSLRITFELLFDGDQIILGIENIYIGHLPILWMIDVADFGLSLFGIQIDDEISSILNQFGTYDHESKILKISVSELIQASMSETQTVHGILSLLKGIQNNNLLRLESKDEILSVVIDGYILEDTSEIQNLNEEDILQTYEDVLQNWYTTVSYIELFQQTLNSTDENVLHYTVEMQQLELNQMLNITLFEMFPNTIEIGSYVIQLNQPYLKIDDELWIEIPIQIVKDHASPVFTTKIKVEVSILYEDDQGSLTLNQMDIGQAVFNQDLLTVLFQLFNVEIEDHQLDITPLLEMFQEEISIQAISIDKDKMNILIEPTASISFMIDQVEQAIQELQFVETLPEVIQTQFNSISNAILTNNVDEMNQAFDDFMLIYDGLDDTIQSEIQLIIFTYLDEAMILGTLLN
jgi:hypothetical protein